MRSKPTTRSRLSEAETSMPISAPHHSYSFERSGNEYANPSPTTRTRLSEAVTSMPTPSPLKPIFQLHFPSFSFIYLGHGKS